MPVPASTPGSPASPKRLRRVVAAGLVVLLLAEAGVRLVEHRLPPSPGWFNAEYGTKRHQMDTLAAHSGGASIVVLGSSVVDTAIDPAALAGGRPRPAYNAGLIGANLEMVDLWSQLVVEPALRPDVAVVGVSSRDVNANGGGLESQTARFLRLGAVRQLLRTESTLQRIERRVGEISHLVRFRVELRRPLGALLDYRAPVHTQALPDGAGFDRQLADLPYRDGPEVAEFFRTSPLRDFRLSARQLGALERSVRRLQSSGTRVVLLDVPVTARYVELHPNGAEDYRAYELALEAVADATGAELIDGGVWEPSRFSDPLHVNRRGVDTLSRLLADRLQVLP